MLGDIDDLIRSNQGERTIISETITTLIDSALDVADLSVNEGDLSRDQKKAIEGLEAGLVKLIKSDIILEHNVTSLRELRDNAKRRMSKEQDDDDDDDDDETTFKPAAEPTLDDIKKHPKFREFYKRVWKKDLDRRSGDESDDDDDLAVVNNQISLVCPITKTIFVNPVKKYITFTLNIVSQHIIISFFIVRTAGILTLVKQFSNTYVQIKIIESLHLALWLDAVQRWRSRL